MNHLSRPISVINLYLFFLILCLWWSVSCKKPDPDNVKLRFSCENATVLFDTVFTSIGSVTRNFTVHNPSNNDIKITVFLAGGNRSFYSINVNGKPGTNENNSYFENIEIPKKDSIYIFVTVNIDPRNQNNPFIVNDSIVFLTGSSGKQDVKLVAYGQDARYIIANEGPEGLRYKVVAGLPFDENGQPTGYEKQHETWTNERPYVVYGWAVIDSACSLTIDPGTKIYFHNNSGLWAYRYSKLDVNGAIDAPVLFRGDRLESWFDDDYAQWSRVWINEGVDATITNAIITNAFVGVQVEPLPTNNNDINVTQNVVTIDKTIIKNTKNCGVLSRFLNVEMTNCVIANNGASGLQLEGGNYILKHLTLANYFKQTERKAPACYVSNKVSLYDDTPWDVKADFVNCIIYGRLETEAGVSKVQDAELEVSFQNCLLKAKDPSSYFKDCLLNKDPKFTDIDRLDFKLLQGSPAIGCGIPNILEIDEDILGNPRGDKPDIGAFQYER
ncbi:MAG: hypothetical protein FWH59_04520 [Lentimicrobiaceae bacterium]|nr:hypothetical protein [Lentimicrobiaceae bacterium]